MNKKRVDKIADVGMAVNVAAGKFGEMAGNAMQAGAKEVGCKAGVKAGKAIEAAGRAYKETAARVGKAGRDDLVSE